MSRIEVCCDDASTVLARMRTTQPVDDSEQAW
jgi:hypothetical protein